MANKNKIDTRAIGLDTGLKLVKWLTGAENLHYGLWDELEVNAMNVRAAQEAYTDLLFSFLPSGSLRILDVGGGAGETARKLIALGHDVDIVVPSSFLAERCRENAPEARVLETKFEDLISDEKFDLVLFSESFQYIPLPTALAHAQDYLVDGGHILIADNFRRADFVRDRSQVQTGDGHKIDDFRAHCTALPIDIIRSQEITESVAPSLEIEQGFYNVFGHGWTRLNDELAIKRSKTHTVIHFVLRRLINAQRRERLDQRFNQNLRSRENFIAHNEYWIFLLQQGS